MITENEVISAIQSISELNNVKENLELFVKVANAAESGEIDLSKLKTMFRDINHSENSIFDLFNVLLLEHDNAKTLYLLKGIEIIMSNKSIDILSGFEKEMVSNLYRTVEDKGVMDAMTIILQKANAIVRFKAIINRY